MQSFRKLRKYHQCTNYGVRGVNLLQVLLLKLSLLITCLSPHLVPPHFYLEKLLQICLHSPSAVSPSNLLFSPLHSGFLLHHTTWVLTSNDQSSSYWPYQKHVTPQTLLSSLTSLSPHPSANHVSSTCKKAQHMTFSAPEPLPSMIITDQSYCSNLLMALLLLLLSSTFSTQQPE